MTEDIELPSRRRMCAQHVALKADPVHEVTDRGLRTGEVGVRLVVGAAHDLNAAFGDHPAQIGSVCWMRVEIRLEVIDLGEHEPVVGVTAGHFQMRRHQREGIVLFAAAGRILGPHAGVGALGVPPDRVVVEVADHEHRPARLGDDEVEFERPRLPGEHLGPAALSRCQTGDVDGDLDRAVAGGGGCGPRCAQPIPDDPDLRWTRRLAVVDPHDLQGGITDEEFG